MQEIKASERQVIEVRRWVLEDKGGSQEHQTHLAGWAGFSWDLYIYDIAGTKLSVVRNLHPVAKDPFSRSHLILCVDEHAAELSPYLEKFPVGLRPVVPQT